MKNYKLFLVNICDIENITVQQLMELTGKSQSVVYSWLNLLKPDFPTIDSLRKILFRLGISLDDFINCRHPVYDDGESARIYYRYVYGSFDQSYICREILDLPNAEEVIKTYLYDRMRLNNMIKDSVNGLEIDTHSFDLLCKALMPMFVSDDSVISDGGQAIYHLDSGTLRSYKLGLEIVKEAAEDSGDDPNFELPEHYMFYPNANYVILLAAEKELSFVNKYLAVVDDLDKRFLLDDYMKICADDPNYDKKNKIIKQLVENNCTFADSKDKDVKEKYSDLMKKILRI